MNLSVSELFSLNTSNEYEILEGDTSSSRNTSYMKGTNNNKNLDLVAEPRITCQNSVLISKSHKLRTGC